MALEIEIIGLEAAGDIVAGEVRQLCELALSTADIEDGHLALQFVGVERMREINRQQRGIDRATDVLAFGIDENRAAVGERELGDVCICPPFAQDLREAIIHGVLHVAGMDHERDQGEMLTLQRELLNWISGSPDQEEASPE